jgi:hypothetical protein
VRTKEADSRQFERGGSVEEGGYSVAINDASNEARLSRGKDGRYKVTGKQGGKPVEATFAAPDGLATEALLQMAARDLLAKKIQTQKFQTFDVERPDGPSTITMRRDPAQAGVILLEGGGTPPVKLEVDASGRTKCSTVSVETRRMTTETLFSSGSLP